MVGMSDVADNLKRTHEQISSACARAGRRADSVRLIAVSKTKPLKAIEEALAAGQKVFGENYVQEAVEKVEHFPQAEWHFIGSLQTNKVKQVVGRFSLIESVDRLKLALEIAKVAERAGQVQDILLQIHVGDEATKQGLSFLEVPSIIEQLIELKSLRLRGIMSMPPMVEDERVGRSYFASLREACEKWRALVPTLTELSMGTSSDFEWAIMEGATMVRLGTSVFGARK
jgi:pyridoxal phosphate enzyme (YggS family)